MSETKNCMPGHPWEGSTKKVHFHQADRLGIHLPKEENQLSEVVPWLPHTCHGTHEPTQHTHSQIIKCMS